MKNDIFFHTLISIEVFILDYVKYIRHNDLNVNHCLIRRVKIWFHSSHYISDFWENRYGTGRYLRFCPFYSQCCGSLYGFDRTNRNDQAFTASFTSTRVFHRYAICTKFHRVRPEVNHRTTEEVERPPKQAYRLRGEQITPTGATGRDIFANSKKVCWSQTES
jgi:hypothetical protein